MQLVVCGGLSKHLSLSNMVKSYLALVQDGQITSILDWQFGQVFSSIDTSMQECVSAALG